ncbi:glycosyl hydrolase [Bacteroides graminisolvens]
MKNLFLLFISALILLGCNKQKLSPMNTLADALYGFQHIQDSTRTKVWWFHGETETTKEGITADLEAYKRAGVGGVVYYDQTHGKMENSLSAFSREWWEMLRFSSEEAKRLGLTFEVHISNGFVAGGPWITPETSMKRLAASQLLVEGGRYFKGKLEAPKNKYDYYKDVAVLAFPVKNHMATSQTVGMKVTSNISSISLENLFKMKADFAEIPFKEAKEKGNVYINIEFKNDFTARNITYEVRPKGLAKTSATNIPGPPQDTFVGTGYYVLPDLGQLEVSTDGVHYSKVCDLKPIYRAHESWCQKTISFKAVRGKYYRLNLHHWWSETMLRKDLSIRAVKLESSAKLDQWEEKAGLYSEYIEKDNTPSYTKMEIIDSKSILNLTDKMDQDGVLRWNAPKGNWMVMRFAYVPTGGHTKHGRANLMGLECDKLSAKAVKVQWDNYVKKILDSLKVTNSGLISGVAMDSHEAGAQNWTDDFIEQFKHRQGYDPTTYLPVMMGFVIDGVKESDGFLFDVRRNIADMMADNYYGTIDKLCNKNSLTFTAQAIGNALCIVGDPIMAKSKVSKPQGEFWAIHPNGNYDIKESSSSAHLYGKRIASAEAFTDVKFSASLASIKSLADYAYAFGINEFVICASAYQPWLNKIPGNTGGGRHYAINRNNTFWEYSAPFWDYQARNSYIMRQGKSSIDLCVYLGENAPVKILTYRLPDMPGGFDFDAFTAHALHTRMDMKDGKITLPDGVNYKMMILPRNGDITLEALQKIVSLVKDGAKIYGPKPMYSHSRKDVEKAQLYKKLSDKLWGENPNIIGVNTVEKGQVYWGMSLKEAINQAGIIPDIQMEKGNAKTAMIYFAHRKLADADIYFLDNHKDIEESNVFTFASKGRYAQLWNTVTGERFSLPIEKSEEGCTSVKLYMNPRESYFVVITNQEEYLPLASWITNKDKTEMIVGKWQVYFDEKSGGPGHVYFNQLSDWTTNADSRIKYYSGTAIYKKTISICKTSNKVYIDLNNPGFVARVFVNSRDAGVVWCSPWQVDITKYIVDGENKIEIHVANSLMNRMIYDASLSESERITYSYPMIATPEDKLEPSGLKEVSLIQRKIN